MLESLSRGWRILRQPVLPESRELLRETWSGIPEEHRTPQQMFGRQGNCCGATIGTMPRCDFACRGCYLGEDANHAPAESVAGIKAQMRALRPLLGNNGNLQLTDGEVTLLPEDDLVELLRYADEVGLVPMLMTHGDSFRRRPGLLERLMERGGLREVSIHVDTTMRGRLGYKEARREEELNPLRDEFAEMIREARRRTGRPLIAATTMTVTAANLDGVADAVRCVARHADAFKMISFQPIAQVGRTEDGLGGGVDVEARWREAARGLHGPGSDPDFLLRGQMWLGHPGCNRYVHGFMLERPGAAEPEFHPLRVEGEARDERAVAGYLERFGGASFRRDTPFEARTRFAAMLMRAPGFWAGEVVPYFWGQLRRMAPEGPLGLAADILRGRARMHHFNVVSHHFMSREQIESAEGRERLDLCVFRLPVDGELVSMCEVNALGVRDRYYEDLQHGRRPGATAFADSGRPAPAPAGQPPALAAPERRPLRVIA